MTEETQDGSPLSEDERNDRYVSGLGRQPGELDVIRTLYVDVDTEFAESMVGRLERSRDDLEVVTEFSPSAGLERLSREAYDCVVSGFRFPETDGLAFLRAVREEYPPLPFILLVEDTNIVDFDQVMDAGATAYLHKQRALERCDELVDTLVAEVRKYHRQVLADERYRRAALFDNCPDPIMEVRFEGETALVEDVNAAFESMFGFDRAAIVGRTVDEVVVPESEYDDHVRFRDRVQSGDAIETEVRRETTSGVREFRLQVIPIDVTDVSSGAYAWYTDITDQKEYERRLEGLHEATADLMRAETTSEIADRAVEAGREVLGLELSHVYLVAETGDGRVLRPEAVTETFRERLGPPPSFAAGEGVLWDVFDAEEPLLYEDTRAGVEKASDLPIKSGILLPLENHGVFGVASTLPAAFDDQDEDVARTLALQTTTALDRADRAVRLRRRNEEIERIAGAAAHDLRNALTTARGYLQELDGDAVEHIEGDLDRMERLVDNVLAVAKTGNRFDERDVEPVALRSVAERCWADVPAGTAALDVALDDDRRVTAHPMLVRQLLENLFRNAVEHGGDDVTVRVGLLDDGEGFYVADDGPGIPPEDRQTVFDHGFSTGSGTGFGLSVVRNICEDHGWNVDVTEGDLGGARFEVTGVDFVR